jgi:hypothetical protein
VAPVLERSVNLNHVQAEARNITIRMETGAADLQARFDPE